MTERNHAPHPPPSNTTPRRMSDSSDKIPQLVDEKVVVDGNLITSQGPATSMAFALQVRTFYDYYYCCVAAVTHWMSTEKSTTGQITHSGIPVYICGRVSFTFGFFSVFIKHGRRI